MMGFDEKIKISVIRVPHTGVYDHYVIKKDPRVIWCNKNFRTWGWNLRDSKTGDLLFKFYRPEDATLFTLRWV